ncbi:hypothetical protein [Entomohabitans teleogrylli]|uniref:hypothetical protein n=1 Tax=Entomohabitans teleogrylli TaxID=1384589 RepID=UPI00073D8634|nr:hypothetical protein [Entomohabitans teleogrylli]
MRPEKIAFLYPYHRIDDGNKMPMLVLETSSLPLTTDMYFQLHFLGLSSDTPYWITASLLKIEGNLEVDISGEKGVWMRARSGENPAKNLAASISLNFDKCIFHEEGHYLIKACIHHDNKPVHSALAYFLVSIIHEE